MLLVIKYPGYHRDSHSSECQAYEEDGETQVRL